jgi:hypothetical protein
MATQQDSASWYRGTQSVVCHRSSAGFGAIGPALKLKPCESHRIAVDLLTVARLATELAKGKISKLAFQY